MPVQVAFSNKYLPTIRTPIRRVALRVQPHMLVQIRRITKRPRANLTLERLVACVGAQVNLEAVLSVVYFAAKQANMGFLLFSHLIGYIQLYRLCAIEHCDFPVYSVRPAFVCYSAQVIHFRRELFAITAAAADFTVCVWLF